MAESKNNVTESEGVNFYTSIDCKDLSSCEEVQKTLKNAKTPHDFEIVAFNIGMAEEKLFEKYKKKKPLIYDEKDDVRELFSYINWYKKNFSSKDDTILDDATILDDKNKASFRSTIETYIRQKDFELAMLKMEVKRKNYLEYLKNNDFSPEVKAVLKMLIEEYIVGKEFDGYTIDKEQSKYMDFFIQNFKKATMLIMDIESNGISQANTRNSGAYGYFQIKNNNGTGPEGWKNSTIHTILILMKRFYARKEKKIPSWVENINKDTDIVKLEPDEQTILFMFYIFTRAEYTEGRVLKDIFYILIGDWGTSKEGAMKSLYGKHHHTNMGKDSPTEKLFRLKFESINNENIKNYIPPAEFNKPQFLKK